MAAGTGEHFTEPRGPWLVAFAIAIVACRGEEESPPMPAVEELSIATPSCADTLRALVVDGDLSSGKGLPAGCSIADADRALGSNVEDGSGRLSSRGRRWRKYRLAGDSVARVWLDGDRILLVAVSHSVVSELPDAIRVRLGEPSAIFEARHNPTHKDWVYPDRGLTITVGGKYETPPRPHVSYLFVYAPTTLDLYVSELGGKDAWVIRRPQR